MTIDRTSLKQAMVNALQARGFAISPPGAGPHQDQMLTALSDSFVDLWVISITVPGNGPNPGSAQPHLHTLTPGIFTAPALEGLILSRLTDFDSNAHSRWEAFVSAWSSGVATHLLSIVTDVKDGNDLSHTHSWLGISSSTLAALIKAPLLANPDFDLNHPVCKMPDYIEGLSEALVNTITSDGTTTPPIVSGSTHQHFPL